MSRSWSFGVGVKRNASHGDFNASTGKKYTGECERNKKRAHLPIKSISWHIDCCPVSVIPGCLECSLVITTKSGTSSWLAERQTSTFATSTTQFTSHYYSIPSEKSSPSWCEPNTTLLDWTETNIKVSERDKKASSTTSSKNPLEKPQFLIIYLGP